MLCLVVQFKKRMNNIPQIQINSNKVIPSVVSSFLGGADERQSISGLEVRPIDDNKIAVVSK